MSADDKLFTMGATAQVSASNILAHRVNKLTQRAGAHERFNLKGFVSRLVFCCWLFSAVALFAQTAQTSTSEGSLTANPVFQQNCAKCHGKNAEGRHFGGPSLVSEKIKSASPDDLRTIISNGKHRMPKYAGKLAAEEINTLVEQIKSLNGK